LKEVKQVGLFENIFKKQTAEQKIQSYFKTLSAYTPIFTTYEGGVYEMEITRAAIHSFATQCSKLKPEIRGKAYKELEKKLQFKPNGFMDTTKFLYRLATILSVNNTAFIVPILDDTGRYITGYYPILPSLCEVVEYEGEPWLRYTFTTGQKAAVEFSKVGIMTQFQYKNDFFGENNAALYPTMQLVNVQNQGIIEGVKQSANIRFMAKLANMLKSSDIEAERKRFTQENLSYENNSGVLMFDTKYADVKQIISKPFIIDSEQMKAIQTNVFNYFGTNEKILQNNFSEDEWNAYYEGKIEPFAIQLSLVMTNMTFTPKEISFGNQLLFTANRLQYASNGSKLDIVTQLFDRGFLTHNQGREVFNMLPIEDGDKYYIRKEYAEVSNLAETQGITGGDDNANKTGQGIPGDTDPAANPDDGKTD
jgi:hypothetical protein